MFVAIDYTASNGNPLDKDSLHYIDPTGAPNQYVSAINAVGQVLAPYDSDQKFPVWGFGGRVNGEKRHCFAVNMNDADPDVNGVQGIVDAYTNSFNTTKLSGPTYFTEIIQTATALGSSTWNPPNDQV